MIGYPPRPMSPPRNQPLLVIVAAALLARVVGIGDESYWYDEIWSLDQVRKPFGDMLAALAREDVHPPLYSVLLWVWTRLVGESEVASRLLSALVGAAAVVPLYGLGRELWDRRTGLMAATLLALNPYAVFYGREARSYSLMLALALWATWALVRWASQPSRGRALVWIAAATLLAYTHVYGSFVLVAQGLWALVFVPALRRPFLAGAATVAALLLPWVPSLLGQAGRVQQGFWIDPITWTDPLDWMRRWYGYSIPLAVLLPLVSLRAAAEAPGGAGDSAPRTSRRALLALWIAVPLAIPVTLSLIGEPIFYHKYPIAILGALSLLAARGLVLLPPWPRRVVAAATAALLAFHLLRDVYLTRSKEQWRELSALATTADAVLVAEPYNRTYLGWYLRAPVVWLDGPADVDRAEQQAQARGGRVLYLQAHPPHGEHEATFAARWRPLETTELVGARATTYLTPGAGPAGRVGGAAAH
ncbi:MAG: hypothetical protein AMXMBFR64_17180 [Myxococcales bacterium]